LLIDQPREPIGARLLERPRLVGEFHRGVVTVRSDFAATNDGTAGTSFPYSSVTASACDCSIHARIVFAGSATSWRVRSGHLRVDFRSTVVQQLTREQPIRSSHDDPR
jgi:hypothetical protein